jgi:hypothetical protein
MKVALPAAPGPQVLPAQTANLFAFSLAGAVLPNRASENPFGGMLFPVSIDPPRDGHFARTPALDGDDSVLVGGTGNDVVIGGQGRNLMAGGFGFDGIAKTHAAAQARDQVFGSLGAGLSLNWLVQDTGLNL